jgi:hypothetical protein
MKKQIANPTELEIWLHDKKVRLTKKAFKIKGTSTRDCLDQAEKLMGLTFKTKQELALYLDLRHGSAFWKKRSLNTFLRQQLKIKGSTEHTGRGAYIGGFSEKWDVVLERLKQKIEDWKQQELIEDIEFNKEDVKIVFTNEYFDENYRTAAFCKNDNCFGVLFSCSPMDSETKYGISEEEFDKLYEQFRKKD